MHSYYNIHDFVTFRVSDNRGAVAKTISHFHLQFENFEVPTCDNVDLRIELGDFKPTLKGARLIDGTYAVKPDYLFASGARKFARWFFEISKTSDSYRLRIQTNLAGALTVPYFITEFLLQYILLQKGVSTIHAAGLEKDGRVILLPGASGGGKTTISLSLDGGTFAFMGDNYVLVKEGTVYSYPSPLNVFSYNLVPTIKQALSRRDRLDLRLRLLIFKMTGGYLKVFKKLNPSRAVSKTSDQGDAAFAAFLVPNDAESISEKPLDHETAIARLHSNMLLEWIDMLPVVSADNYVGGGLFGGIWENSLNEMTKNFEHLDRFYEIKVPERYSEQSREKVGQKLLHYFFDRS